MFGSAEQISPSGVVHSGSYHDWHDQLNQFICLLKNNQSKNIKKKRLGFNTFKYSILQSP